MRNPHTLLSLPSPCYVLEEERLNANLDILESIQTQSGAKILLALKGYAFWRRFDRLRTILSGSTASGLYEARLGFEEIGGRGRVKMECAKMEGAQEYKGRESRESESKERESLENTQEESISESSTHHITSHAAHHTSSTACHSAPHKEVCVFSPAYKQSEFSQILAYATHVIFNSFAQWQKFKPQIDAKNAALLQEGFPPIEVGLRVNPLYSEVSPPIYNPCIKGSRLGIIPDEFEKGVAEFGLKGIDGLHFHTHCEQDSTALARTLPHFERHFGAYIPQMKWINFGGGHHITREDYDRELLISLVREFKARHNVEVFLEPGEAVGWQVGFLIGEVVDIVKNAQDIAILDVSAAAHMPDCLEMPYRPNLTKLSKHPESSPASPLDSEISESRWILEADKGEKEGKCTYRLGGPTCLAGDVIGDYSFDTPLQIGDRVIFEDMLHYTIVKNNTFNGVPLPSLGVIDTQGHFTLLKSFSYEDYKQRN